MGFLADSDRALELLLAHPGDKKVLGEILEGYRGKLDHFVDSRLDRRLKPRIDPSDVIQETYLEVLMRIETYLLNPRIPFYCWLRFITTQKVLQLQRAHLCAKMRSAAFEVSLQDRYFLDQGVILPGEFLEDGDSSPILRLESKERREILRKALKEMSSTDRKILLLRHFKLLSNSGISRALGIKESAASMRYLRALKRLKKIIYIKFKLWED